MKKTLTGCFLHFFGKRDNSQTMAQFSEEIKAAVSADREFWVSEFTRVGYTVIAS